MKCEKRKTPCISGVWNYSDLLGSTVKIVAMSPGDLSRFRLSFDTDDEYTVTDIVFRVAEDGKIMPGLILGGIENRVYNLREVVAISKSTPNYAAVCGEFLCGQALVGHDVDLTGYDESIGGIALIDENGNIINNRYIKINSTDTEDPTTDTDNVTNIDINVTGNVLD
jgi:hypothetical protein